MITTRPRALAEELARLHVRWTAEIPTAADPAPILRTRWGGAWTPPPQVWPQASYRAHLIAARHLVDADQADENDRIRILVPLLVAAVDAARETDPALARVWASASPPARTGALLALAWGHTGPREANAAGLRGWRCEAAVRHRLDAGVNHGELVRVVASGVPEASLAEALLMTRRFLGAGTAYHLRQQVAGR
ncbi:hypothetical protein [Nocardiopsis sp. CC223A]|uniref:hypothetical protein n=1 Tax=Nocardiopsis sp. CC223A TaxID=3044051 RepID=UPI00278C3123|nr:hypothetical protein [Nocardiopsis sp. CC223A]